MLWRDLTIEQQLNWLICLHVPWFRCDKADDWLLWGMGGICVLQAPSLDHRLSVASLFSYNISGYHKGNASRQQIPASHMNILILRIQTAAPYKNLDRRHNWTDSRRSDTWISLHLYFCSYPATTFNVLKTYTIDYPDFLVLRVLTYLSWWSTCLKRSLGQVWLLYQFVTKTISNEALNLITVVTKPSDLA